MQWQDVKVTYLLYARERRKKTTKKSTKKKK